MSPNMPPKEAGSPLKSSPPLCPPSSNEPPSYAAHGAQQPYPVQPYFAQYPYFYTPDQIQPPRRRSPIRRFCTAVGWAVAIWLLLASLIQSVILVAQFNTISEELPADEDFPIPPELERVRCVWGDQHSGQIPLKASYKQILRAPLTFPFKREEKFELPIESDALFFLSRGVYSGGVVKIKTSDKHDDVARVKVRLEYLQPGGPKIAKVCQFKRDDGGNGIGVFTPFHARYPRHHNLKFFITIKLPKSNSSDLLHIKRLETDLPNFTHLLGDLGKAGIFLEDVSLRGANGGIIAGSLLAQKGLIETSNGPVVVHLTSLGPFEVTSRNGAIQGAFNATGSLILRTSHDRIKGPVFLNTDDSGSASLELTTKDSIIDTDVRLQTDSTGGDFEIVATTSNSPLRVRIREAPLDSKLSLNAKSSNSPVDVVLHPAFEGDFEVSTVHFWPSVSVNSAARDPSGGGRVRDVQVSRNKNHVSGSVSWSDEGKGRGRVDVKTTNSPAVLRL
ncbi:hypothetical protein APHAL10511_000662 [Amanita phalloides]|nr:hypothetical protein APHAL10511_000662 [Amanita phalloides]